MSNEYEYEDVSPDGTQILRHRREKDFVLAIGE